LKKKVGENAENVEKKGKGMKKRKEGSGIELGTAEVELGAAVWPSK
jgi:hypothetical protein